MATSPQLRLVQDPPPAHGTTQDPVRQVFEHWVFMFGYMPARTKLDADRKRVIAAALALYDWDVETILLAVEGMAAVPLGDKPQGMQDAMRNIEWFLARSSRIEDALRWRDRMQLVAQRSAALAAMPLPSASPAERTPEERAALQAAKDRIKALAEQGRQGLWRSG